MKKKVLARPESDQYEGNSRPPSLKKGSRPPAFFVPLRVKEVCGNILEKYRWYKSDCCQVIICISRETICVEQHFCVIVVLLRHQLVFHIHIYIQNHGFHNSRTNTRGIPSIEGKHYQSIQKTRYLPLFSIRNTF